MVFVNTFGNNLRRARLARKLSQKRLGEMANLSQAAISSYERGERRETRDLLALARALQVNPWWLEGSLSATDAPPAKFTLSEPLPAEANQVAFEFDWPFSSISPLDYYSLNSQQREQVENVVQQIIKICQAAT